ncbi:hypothetical protein MsAg5_01030 [Methanosarcinaceae archaeon Ag5]|uniref:Uncharacterized protein n=1 Tax=Methanolapillus africanus TaxID=3028297 RepID=A0AAE4SD05_9EURY|nr:hypothetical protein [Methanosarcinaceae archaeon Ag5]
MEIDDSFASPEEIMDALSEEGFTFKIGFDDDDSEPDDAEDRTNGNLSDAVFSTDLEPDEIRRLESVLEDVDEEEAEDFDECGGGADETPVPGFAQNEIIYFDLFKSKRYVKTLIFQKEESCGKSVYYLVGDCEAPMCFGK